MSGTILLLPQNCNRCYGTILLPTSAGRTERRFRYHRRRRRRRRYNHNDDNTAVVCHNHERQTIRIYKIRLLFLLRFFFFFKFLPSSLSNVYSRPSSVRPPYPVRDDVPVNFTVRPVFRSSFFFFQSVVAKSRPALHGSSSSSSSFVAGRPSSSSFQYDAAVNASSPIRSDPTVADSRRPPPYSADWTKR